MNNRLAIIFMAIAMILLASNDAIFKFLGGQIPMGEAVALRGVFLVSLLAAMLVINGDSIKSRYLMNRWAIVRGLFELFATFLFLSSLSHVPLAVATTLVFTSPILLTALSGPLFKERVGPWRWAAVIAGFAGVLMVTWRGVSEKDIYILMPLAAAIGVAGRDIATRYIPEEIPAASVTLTTSIIVLLAASLTIFGGWTPVNLTHVAFGIAAAIIVGLSFVINIKALRIGELSLLAPVQYVVILCALAYGALFWDEIPDARALAGGAIVIGSGLVILWREKVSRGRDV